MTFRLPREQLYDLVWSEPMQRLSQQIGISDVAIAKHCRRVGVPWSLGCPGTPSAHQFWRTRHDSNV